MVELSFKPIPFNPYIKFKKYLRKHVWIHYIFHITYCFIKDNITCKYTFYTPPEWAVWHMGDKVDV